MVTVVILARRSAPERVRLGHPPHRMPAMVLPALQSGRVTSVLPLLLRPERILGETLWRTIARARWENDV
jgi:hypothetical protein